MILNSLKEGLAGASAYYKQQRELSYCERKIVHCEFGLVYISYFLSLPHRYEARIWEEFAVLQVP